MKTAKRLLSIQLVLGAIGAFVSFSYIHWGAMSSAWAHNLRVEFQKMQQSPGFKEPPAIQGQSVSRILEDLQAYGDGRGHVALYWSLTCVLLTVLAGICLWQLREPASNKSLHSTPR